MRAGVLPVRNGRNRMASVPRSPPESCSAAVAVEVFEFWIYFEDRNNRFPHRLVVGWEIK